MSAASSKSFSAQLSDFLTFASYLQLTSNRPLADCVLSLREQPRKAVWFGGYNTKLLLPKNNNPNRFPFEIQYFRQRRRSSRSGQLAQRLKGTMVSENGATQMLAKVNFTGGAVFMFWLTIVLVVVSIIPALVTRQPIALVLVLVPAPLPLILGGIMWLDRYHLTKIVRNSMSN